METIIQTPSGKNYRPLIWTLTLAINGLIALAFFLPNIEILKQYDFSFLPKLNAILNSLTFISLIVALVAVKQKNIKRHRNFVLLALFWTSLFLVSYLLYHFSTPSTSFGGQGITKVIYLFILLTHIVLAAIIVPLALISIGRGLNMEVSKHKKIVRWTMPIWLYVSLTGVIVYLMISPYYS
ncbi:DUF420 domain-containing protein [Parapedobacter koreensis]|uniref:Putative membrane protein n=1 Tax=Parapedobacter koreensis TaxID=332977 RepID=A0A1H7P5X9_9SPHI|nr:DUF420 domain-containing protein [Parapedobacter koreensis]SEL30655.1 putative membrane protein [Parapedobacter koreensis]